jgi:hypothetical protein
VVCPVVRIPGDARTAGGRSPGGALVNLALSRQPLLPVDQDGTLLKRQGIAQSRLYGCPTGSEPRASTPLAQSPAFPPQ